MARVSRFMRSRPGAVDIDEWQEFALTHPRRGRGLLSMEAEFGPDWETVVPRLWRIHGERLTGEWIAASHRKGYGISRPALWYAFDGPDEERRVMNPPAPDEEARWREENTWFGRMVGAGICLAGGWWLESEADYPARHGLLTQETPGNRPR